MNYALAYSGSDKTTSCGGISVREDGDIKTYRREVETELLEREYSEKDTMAVDAISRQDVLCNTLKELNISGTLDQYYDEQGNVMLYTASEDPFRITISPDILSGFTFVVNDSAIAYDGLYYPVMHHLTKEGISALLRRGMEWFFRQIRLSEQRLRIPGAVQEDMSCAKMHLSGKQSPERHMHKL